MHLYKETTLTKFIESEQPLLVFAEFNRILVSPQEKAKYFGLVKNMPADIEELLKDLRVLGKREVGNILRWRGKIIHHFNQLKDKEERIEVKGKADLDEIEV